MMIQLSILAILMITLIKVLKIEESHSDIELKKEWDIIFNMSVNLTLKKKSKILSGATKLIYVFFHQSCAVDSVRQELGNFPYSIKAAL